MKFDEEKIKNILLKENYITEEDVISAEKFAAAHHSSVINYLLQENLLTQDLLGQAIAESYGVPYVDLNSRQPSLKQVESIPEHIAKQYRIVLFSYTEHTLVITTDNPAQLELTSLLQQLFPQYAIQIAYSLPEDIDACFVHYQKSLTTRFSKIIKDKERIAPGLLEEIFDDALVYHASDIHFEPQKDQVLIRFRIDGVLHEAGQIPKEYYANILNRIKVQSDLRIDEHFVTQDGSLQYTKNNVSVDMRTSIIPTVEGEKVVLRILEAYIEGFSLVHLGLSTRQQEQLQRAAKKPFGMILAVGPTGSGKTTTLYALLKLANNPDVNITTIEDPVEYKIPGVNQIQVNPDVHLTFSKGLRSIVRQDPDIIFVGEIRDTDTAEIAVNAALTGHVLYSTFHANDAATAIPRLFDMGIEPFLLASTLQCIIAQRLVRKICDHCRYSVTKSVHDFDSPQLKIIKSYFDTDTVTLYEGKKCNACSQTGYKGRIAIFEFIQMSPEMQNLILHSPSTKEIWQLAREEGSKSLFEDGIEKVKAGMTTIEELLRVAEPPEQ